MTEPSSNGVNMEVTAQSLNIGENWDPEESRSRNAARTTRPRHRPGGRIDRNNPARNRGVPGKEALHLLGHLSGDSLKAVERCFGWKQKGLLARVQVTPTVPLLPEEIA